jgi:hypothetical protein
MVGLHTGPTIIRGLRVYGATGTAPRTKNPCSLGVGTQMIFPGTNAVQGPYADRQMHSSVRFHLIDASMAAFVVSLVVQQGFHIRNAFLNNTRPSKYDSGSRGFCSGRECSPQRNAKLLRVVSGPEPFLMLRFAPDQLSGPRHQHVKRLGWRPTALYVVGINGFYIHDRPLFTVLDIAQLTTVVRHNFLSLLAMCISFTLYLAASLLHIS